MGTWQLWVCGLCCQIEVPEPHQFGLVTAVHVRPCDIVVVAAAAIDLPPPMPVHGILKIYDSLVNSSFVRSVLDIASSDNAIGLLIPTFNSDNFHMLSLPICQGKSGGIKMNYMKSFGKGIAIVGININDSTDNPVIRYSLTYCSIQANSFSIPLTLFPSCQRCPPVDYYYRFLYDVKNHIIRKTKLCLFFSKK